MSSLLLIGPTEPNLNFIANICFQHTVDCLKTFDDELMAPVSRILSVTSHRDVVITKYKTDICLQMFAKSH